MADTTTLVPFGQALATAGALANEYARRDVFDDYLRRKAANTLRAQRADLAAWAEYLCAATSGAHCPDAEALQRRPEAWSGVTWGLVAGFVRWLLAAGYAIGTINRRLVTVKVYCKLAAQAGVLDVAEAALIRTVQGYGGKDAQRVDERRDRTRRGAKKAQPVPLTAEQIVRLKTEHPDTPQGRRDALLMCLLLDHGLRVSEVALLTVDAFERDGQGCMMMRFYRPKVGKEQRHRLTPDTLRALTAYMLHDAPQQGRLFRQSVKDGTLKTGSGVSERNLSERVRTLGRALGIENLSAHDCRHAWATRAVAAGTDAFALRDAGGWASLAMPGRYVNAAAVANERVRL